MTECKKWCNGCKQSLPIDSFHIRKFVADGRSSRCKMCKHIWYIEQAKKLVYPMGKYILPRAITYDDKKHKVWRAIDAVRRAINRGELTPTPCEVCEERWDTEAHHQNYDSPLDVNWLCSSCHKRIHYAVSEVVKAVKCG